MFTRPQKRKTQTLKAIRLHTMHKNVYPLFCSFKELLSHDEPFNSGVALLAWPDDACHLIGILKHAFPHETSNPNPFHSIDLRPIFTSSASYMRCQSIFFKNFTSFLCQELKKNETVKDPYRQRVQDGKPLYILLAYTYVHIHWK